MFAVGQVRGGSVKHAAGPSIRFGGRRSPSNASSWAGRVQSCCGYPTRVRCKMLVGMNANSATRRLRACWRTRTEWWERS